MGRVPALSSTRSGEGRLASLSSGQSGRNEVVVGIVHALPIRITLSREDREEWAHRSFPGALGVQAISRSTSVEWPPSGSD